MKNSFKTLASWALVAITLLLGVVQPVSANLPAQTAGTVIESLPERPLYGPEAVLAPQFDPGFGSTVDSGGQVQWNNVPWSEMVYQSLDP
ncbi:MAG TPA: hypothetical protein PKG95_12190, partial [Anaerolineaceae bacterium]|nr:hypothetical protein [Anaerolineaceae bacterium]